MALDEVRELMMATNKILSPASGQPIVTPSQDIVLGCYYLTMEPRQPMPPNVHDLPLLGSKTEVIYAYDTGALKTHDRVRLANPDFDKPTVFGNANPKVLETTVGRVLFSEIWPTELGFYNRPVKKSDLSELILKCFTHAGHIKTVDMLDKLKAVGFQAATRAGVSIGIDDMLIPSEKAKAVDKAYKRVQKVKKGQKAKKVKKLRRTITLTIINNAIMKIWNDCIDLVSSAVETTLANNGGKPTANPLWLMMTSGARGNKTQVRQLVGLRGFMLKPGGDLVKNPILANFREGLSVPEYFDSTHGARKGMSDTALKTADAGYLTRKLVAVAQDVIITEDDCGTVLGRWVQGVVTGKETVISLWERIVGRTACRTNKGSARCQQDTRGSKSGH